MFDHFSTAVINRSFKEIKYLNFILTGIATLITLFFLILLSPTWESILPNTIMTGCYMLSTCFSLSEILKFCTAHYGNDIKKFRRIRYFLSYSSSAILLLISWPTTAYISNMKWHFLDLKLLSIFILESTIFTTGILLVHNLLLLYINKNNTDLAFSNLKIKSAEAENLLLRQQIHPHFLFNSLHTLKALYNKDTQMGDDYLIQLADFLRAAVSNHDKIASMVSQELLMCENYLNMQKMRFGSLLEWEINIDSAEILDGYVPSFSLQPLVENAIKHNALTEEKPLRITINMNEDIITIFNTINSKSYKEVSLGSGLANLGDRYFLWSGNQIEVKNELGFFSVSLKIKKNEDLNN